MDMKKADKIVVKVGIVAACVVCGCLGWLNGSLKSDD